MCDALAEAGWDGSQESDFKAQTLHGRRKSEGPEPDPLALLCTYYYGARASSAGTARVESTGKEREAGVRVAQIAYLPAVCVQTSAPYVLVLPPYISFSRTLRSAGGTGMKRDFDAAKTLFSLDLVHSDFYRLFSERRLDRFPTDEVLFYRVIISKHSIKSLFSALPVKNVWRCREPWKHAAGFSTRAGERVLSTEVECVRAHTYFVFGLG